MQAKGGKDQIGIVQTTQDIRFVEQKFPGLSCRAIAAQFMEDQVIALFELTLEDDEIRVVEEAPLPTGSSTRSRPPGYPDL